MFHLTGHHGFCDAAIFKVRDHLAELADADRREKLIKRETDFSVAATKKGTVNAFDAYLDEDARMLRADIAPALGKQRALEVLSSRLGTLSWQPTMADVSTSGDLGYTYGTFEFKSRGVLVEHGSYVRVWKKIGRAWQIVMDVASPDPAQ